jgi:hypothetical protein
MGDNDIDFTELPAAVTNTPWTVKSQCVENRQLPGSS